VAFTLTVAAFPFSPAFFSRVTVANASEASFHLGQLCHAVFSARDFIAVYHPVVAPTEEA
jgi:hypothetical protein